MRTGHFKERTGQLIALSDSKVVWSFVGLLFVLALVAPLVLGNYQLTLLVSALIAVIGAVGLNMLTGTTGLISLGQAGFLAVGAYTNAILMMDYGWPVWLSLPAGGVAAALISILVGVPSLRLRGDYLAIVTLGFNEIVRVAFTNMGSTALRATAVEEALSGGTVDADSIAAASEKAADGTEPPGDLHATPEYKAHLARVLTKRALTTAVS